MLLIVFGGDGDFTHDAFAARINADLSNDVGNLLQRVLSFIAARYDHVIPAGKLCYMNATLSLSHRSTYMSRIAIVSL